MNYSLKNMIELDGGEDVRHCEIHSNQCSVVQLAEQLKHQQDIQASMNALLRLSLIDMSLEDLLTATLDLLTGISWLSLQERGAIFIVEGNSNYLVMKAQKGLANILLEKCARIPFGTCLCGKAASERQIQFADRLDERHETIYEGILPHGHYCVPIMYGEDILGVINLYVREGHERQEEEEEFLGAIADTLAGIIIRRQAEEALRRNMEIIEHALDGVVNALAAVTEKRDPYTAGHQQRVAELAVEIAKEMDLPPDTIKNIRISALLHDIGKINIPAEILTKPGKLTELEMAFVRLHSTMSFEILNNIHFFMPVAQIVLQHHEKLDGSGYPLELKENDILLEAKVLMVADVVEAMASHRPYRPALGIQKAMEEISNNSGILFDKTIVDACLRLFGRDSAFL
ncbi:MAG: HD domain-containing protein [Syntrophomonadaceae bacterium]|nr:HD domain-containing protein [Syntrophomonadaceae bacterium]